MNKINSVEVKYWNSFDYMKLICALLVVIIHVNPLSENGGCNFIVVQMLPRVAVPFFFSISGFIFYDKIQKGKNSGYRFCCLVLRNNCCNFTGLL